ncbi:MAG TPA: C-terminal helicase domain-containing protein, partial [Ignavibacteriaceae bacterium]
LEKGLVPLDELNRKGCLILDEFEDFQDTSINPLPKYLWFLSGIPADVLKEKISSVIGSDEPVVSFGRTKGEVADSLPRKVRQDYWVQMDHDQKLEYEKTLETGREKIYDLVQAGNPFLVQSNVFTLIHQLTQIGNFHGKSESSAKSELLLHHVKSIQKSGKQVFVYSQYDRQGTQRLEKLFAKNKIKYVLYQAGISLKEMEDAIKNFAKDKSITVFLAGMKATNSKINLADVPYMIHFDQWWSPVTTWQAEERVNANTNDPAKLKLNVYNYFVKNSIDEKIQLKLREKGLDNKNLFDLLSSEGMYSLITNEDWLEVLELIEPKDPSELKEARKANLDYLLKLTPDDFSHKIKALLGRIGYKNASFKTSFNPDEVRIFASAIKNSTEVKVAVQCLTMKVVHKKIVKEFADSLVTNTEKIFAFASGEFDQKLINNPGDDRIVLIDKHQIANYLNMFSLV